MLTCGNKVSPASLLNGPSANDSGIPDPSILMNSGDSQHSQVSLFSSSDVPSSLELFSQPHETTGTTTCCTNAGHSSNDSTCTKSIEMTRPLALGENKYYLRYLSGKTNEAKQCGEIKSVISDNIDSISTKTFFDAWKGKQQDQWERKQLLSDVTSIMNEAVTKLNNCIEDLREEMKDSLAQMKSHTEKIQSQCDQPSLNLFTQLLKGQEESKKMVREMTNEISQQRNSSELLSRQILLENKSFVCALPTLSEDIIKGVTSSVQKASVSCTNVSTQVSFSTVNSQHEPTDQAVPANTSTKECQTLPTGDLYHDSNQKENKNRTETNSQRRRQSFAFKDVIDNSEMECVNRGHPRSPYARVCMHPPLQSLNAVDNIQLSPTLKYISNKLCSPGKRKHEQSPSIPTKKICKSINRGGKKTVKPKSNTIGRRRSSRITQRSLNSSNNSGSAMRENHITSPLFEESALLKDSGSKIQRKVFVKPIGGISSHDSSYVDSPINALSDAFYSSKTSSLKLSDKFCSFASDKGKFHRSNEAAIRRVKVISNLPDSGLLLHEIKNSIWKNHLDPDTSP